MNLKKIIAAAMAFAIVGGSAAANYRFSPEIVLTASAEEKIYNGLKYSVYDGEVDEEVRITGYTDDLPAVPEIPAEIEGMPVTSIGHDAFRGCTIKGYTGSYAETYATKYSIPFESLENAPTTTTTTTTTKKPTTTTTTTTTKTTTSATTTAITYENVMDKRIIGTWDIYKVVDSKTGEETLKTTDDILYRFEFTGDFKGVVSYDSGDGLIKKAFTWTASEEAAGGKNKVLAIPDNGKEGAVFEIGDDEIFCEYTNNRGTRKLYFKKAVTEAELNLGDVNGDGIINAVDASKILILYAELSADLVKPSESEFYVCDINNDSLINAVDASLVLAYYANLAQTPDLTLDTFLEEIKD